MVCVDVDNDVVVDVEVDVVVVVDDAFDGSVYNLNPLAGIDG
jgi:hypothetical protein